MKAKIYTTHLASTEGVNRPVVVVNAATVYALVDLDTSPEGLAAAATLAGPIEIMTARRIVDRQLVAEENHLAAINARLDGLAVEASPETTSSTDGGLRHSARRVSSAVPSSSCAGLRVMAQAILDWCRP